MRLTPEALCHFPAWILVCSTGALVVGCANNSKMAFVEALEEYNDGVRWGRGTEVAHYISGPQQAQFLARVEALRDLQITECRVDRVSFSSERSAQVLVSIDWYSLRTGRLEHTLMSQTWAKQGDRWRVSDQRWVRGATFPLFARR